LISSSGAIYRKGKCNVLGAFERGCSKEEIVACLMYYPDIVGGKRERRWIHQAM
jgi:hypothetical protein